MASDGSTAASDTCTFERFRELLHAADMYASSDRLDPAVVGEADGGNGTPLGYMGEALLWRLLQWQPSKRISAHDALHKHVRHCLVCSTDCIPPP
jgi:hypothetical protein